jgi:hypothetical protein
MKYTLPFLTLFLLISLLPGSYVAPQTSGQSVEKPLYRKTGNEANLAGTINVTGKIPKPLKIDMSVDPVCMQLNSNPETSWLIANGDRLSNAFVYLKSEMLNDYSFEMPASEVVLHRRNCEYSPRVLGLRVGQSLRIINEDPTQHNTHPVPKINIEWNLTQSAQAPPVVKTFARPEVLIPFKCNQHPWEKAFVAVLNHPFFAVTNELGTYEISGLPAGIYKVVVWHEALGEKELDITVVAGESRRVDFTFDTDKDLKILFRRPPRGQVTQHVSPRRVESFPGR